MPISNKNQPSPYDVLYRWPKAIMAVSALILWGDEKHKGDGRPEGRGQKINNDRYDFSYSTEKLHRHDARIADGEIFDRENGHPHVVARAWHALNALEAYLYEQGYEIDDIINQYHVFREEDKCI